MRDLPPTSVEFICRPPRFPTMARAREKLLQGRRALFALVIATTILSGCAAVDASQQRLVSKANMQFSDSSVFAYQGKLFAQTEPGSASSGGSQSAGCTSCR